MAILCIFYISLNSTFSLEPKFLSVRSFSSPAYNVGFLSLECTDPDQRRSIPVKIERQHQQIKQAQSKCESSKQKNVILNKYWTEVIVKEHKEDCPNIDQEMKRMNKNQKVRWVSESF